MDRPLLILDLDETLVYATKKSADVGHDFRVLDYYVRKRPHLDEFLERIFDWFEVAVWTSAGGIYAAEVVSLLFSESQKLRFVWDGRRCTSRRDPETDFFYNIKDLKKVKRSGFNLERVVMIDDTPRKLSRNYGNHLRLAAFEGDAGDRELQAVLPYLEWLSKQKNIRTIEKRRWRKWSETQ